MNQKTSQIIDGLRPNKPHRLTSAEQTSDVIREAITTGVLTPGMKLQEEALTASLGVARNTLRESFKTLIHEGLLVHEINRGVSVVKVTVDGIRDVYAVRELLEVNALRDCPADADISAIAAAVESARTMVEKDDWLGVGTANIAFHRAIVALAGSSRQNAIMRSLLAETRLHVSAWGHPREWHAPFVEKNRQVYEMLARGRRDEAAVLMSQNLKESCRILVARHEEGHHENLAG
ncbi:GntR family transcriptional regulator [Paenarthrobacter sp. NPDC091711]|uniref:GntR family transcriptional regulator n=1 Tax=Paenarthrobacter sp. NPDC091711 TaxID=3364385 RepID=UPI00381E6B5D